MDTIAAEVGQKMRSAIKAKLLELNCYVDDELPDYIMVMVANKRTKAQMNEDLHLFLSSKTSTFVDWLHIVLKKLKEVTVTNPEVYKKVTKRKSNELPDVKVKKEKKDSGTLKQKKNLIEDTATKSKSLTDNLLINANQLAEQRKIVILNEGKTNENNFDDSFDIPLLSEVNMSSEKDLQDIEKKIKSVKSRLGLLVDSDIEEELPVLKSEKDDYTYRSQSKNSKDNREVIQIQNTENVSSFSSQLEENRTKTKESVDSADEIITNNEKKSEHKRITFETNNSPKKPSILERLGKKPSNENTLSTSVRGKISLSEFRKEEEPYLQYSRDSRSDSRDCDDERDWRMRKGRSRIQRKSRRGSFLEKRPSSRDRKRDRSNEFRSETRKESILSRLGVMSKISLPPKEPKEPEPEDELKTREVRSTVQVKPRVIPSGISQPNKNLLLKAVAEAQRSVAQTPKVGSHLKHLESSAMTKYIEFKTRNKEQSSEETHTRKLSQNEKIKLKNLILAQTVQRDRQILSEEDGKDEDEYIPRPVKKIARESPKYVPTSISEREIATNMIDSGAKQQFVVTLEGIEKTQFTNNEAKVSVMSRLDTKPCSKLTLKSRLEERKSPSPIIFDKITTKVNSKTNIPDKLPIVHPPLSIKNKERCKYWPSCRQGDKCEFVHPSNNCEMFPHCKFGDKCLYLHPTCKFGSSCTKRECPYSHIIISKAVASRVSLGKLTTSSVQICKYLPNCTNTSCSFYHPKLCKFGKYCKNQVECGFSHVYAGNKSLSWRLK